MWRSRGRCVVLGSLMAYAAGTLFLFIGLALGVGLAAYAIYYLVFKLK